MTGDETHAEGPVTWWTWFAQVHATLAIARAVADLAAAVRERQENSDAHLANLVDAVHLLREQLAGDGEG